MKTISKLNILMTGAGGPAAVCAFKSLHDNVGSIHMADMDQCAAGLYLVPKEKRHLIPAGDIYHFADTILKLCIQHQIDILIPTVDVELTTLSPHIQRFENYGIQVLISPKKALDIIMDKYALLNHVEPRVEVGSFDMLAAASPDQWIDKKVVIKPIRGSGSRGVEVYERYQDIPKSKLALENLMIQEFAEGPEYSVDIMVAKDGAVKAAIPRVRMRIDSGVSMTGMVENNAQVIDYVKKVVQNLGIRYSANVQVILSPTKGPRLIEINPRFSGGLSLVIESGADTPMMSIKECLGHTVETVKTFKEIGMVRTFSETFIQSDELMHVS